jgi:hypothetical protein
VNQNVETVAEARAQAFTHISPLLLKAGAGNGNIHDGEVEPFYMSGAYLVSQCCYRKVRQFMFLNQRNNDSSTPSANGLDVRAQIPVPRSGGCICLFLTRAESYADATATWEANNLGDLKRVSGTCSLHVLLLALLVAPVV